MITISNTEVNTWQRCRRKWFLAYFLGYQPAVEEVTGHRILGVRVHTALEGYYGYDLDPLAVLGVRPRPWWRATSSGPPRPGPTPG